MLGIHLTLLPGKLREIAELHRQGKITSPKSIRIVGEYVWDFKYLVVLVEAGDVDAVASFAQQFSKYTTDQEIAPVATLEELACSTGTRRTKPS